MENRPLKNRRTGLEQEFFLVDEDGSISGRADEFIGRAGELAAAEGRDPEHFAPECARNLVEVSTPPAESLEELSTEYLDNLRIAVRAGWDFGLRLYPLATYPLPFIPDMRKDEHYEMQALTMGRERFLHAGRCAGVHLHVELAPGTTDPRIGVAYDASRHARRELLDTYNVATALDAAIIALTRSASFYEGFLHGVATRTAYYRGSPDFAPYGLYAGLQPVGGLLPYADSVGDLVARQFDRYYALLSAMDRAGVGRQLFHGTGNGLLDAAWNPVRVNAQGTVELRGLDGNYPEVVLGVAGLVRRAVDRTREEGLSVTPTKGATTFEAGGNVLRVPDFEYLGTELFRAAATAGLESPIVVEYLDSILDFAGGAPGLQGLGADGPYRPYRNTETEILESVGFSGEVIPEEQGLRLVREACDELERQVAASHYRRDKETTKAGADGD